MRPAPLTLGRACSSSPRRLRPLRCGERLVRPERDHEVPALAAVVCAEPCLATLTERRGALGGRLGGTCTLQTRALCLTYDSESRLGDRAERAPGRAVRWPPPRRCSPDSGSPATHPIGQPGRLNRAKVNVAHLLPSGRVSERQTGHGLTNSGRRSTTCRRKAGEDPPRGSPKRPPAGRAAGLGGARRGPAECVVRGPASAGVRRRTRSFPWITQRWPEGRAGRTYGGWS